MFTAWQPAVVPPEAEALPLLGPLHPPGHHAPGTGEAPTESSATAWIVDPKFLSLFVMAQDSVL
jgi:hypothetical protein